MTDTLKSIQEPKRLGVATGHGRTILNHVFKRWSLPLIYWIKRRTQKVSLVFGYEVKS